MNYQRANLPEDPNARSGAVVAPGQSALALRDPYTSAVGYYGIPPEGSEFKINLLEYLQIVLKHRWMILSIVGAALVFAVLTTLMQTPLYTSAVRLQIDQQVAKIVENGNITPYEGQDSEFQKTQVELLEGRTMAERVASSLKLGGDPDFFKPRSFSITAYIKRLLGFGGTPPIQPSKANIADLNAAAAGVVLGNRAVLPVPGSRLVDIAYTDPNPARAQRIAAAFADAFIASNLDKRFQANAYAKAFLEDQLTQMKLRLEKSEKSLIDFGQKEQIVQANDKESIAETNLAAANSALSKLIDDRIKNEELWKQLEKTNAINLPQLLSNQVIQDLQLKRNNLETDYQQKLQTFKPSYPTMMELSSQIAEIDKQLSDQVQTLKASYKAAYEFSLSQEDEMKKRIVSLREDVLDLQKRSIQYNILKREVDTNQSLYDSLLQRYKEVDIAGGVGSNNVFVVDSATLPGAPSSPRMSRALFMAFVLGLVAALGAAFVLEHLDDTLRSPEDVERALGFATLGIIPKIETGRTLQAELADPRSHIAESYRSLCTALQLSTESGLPKTLLVTSAGPGEGKSTTCLTIARHFANIGLKVLIIDADLRKPSLHTKLKLENTVGLSTYLTGAAEPPKLLQKTDAANLAFMASGPLPPNAADLLGSSRLLSLLSVGLEVFDFIIVDSPPVMGLADAPLLSNAIGSTIFVVGAGQVRSKLIRGAVRRLQLARSSIVGTAITRFDARRSYGYGYGSGYGYGYGHGYGGPGDGQAAEPATVNVDGTEQRKLTNARVRA